MSHKLDSTKWLCKKIAEKAGISMETLQELRKNPRFMRFVDTFKKELSREIREDLLVNSYQLEEYDSLAIDFSLFDEVLQMPIRVPLFSHLKKISQSIKSRTTHGLKIDTSEFMLFRRLFSFFILIEKYSPTLVSKSLQEMKQIAEDIVWPALDMDKKEIDNILSKPISTKEERLKELKAKIYDI